MHAARAASSSGGAAVAAQTDGTTRTGAKRAAAAAAAHKSLARLGPEVARLVCKKGPQKGRTRSQNCTCTLGQVRAPRARPITVVGLVRRIRVELGCDQLYRPARELSKKNYASARRVHYVGPVSAAAIVQIHLRATRLHNKTPIKSNGKRAFGLVSGRPKRVLYGSKVAKPAQRMSAAVACD